MSANLTMKGIGVLGRRIVGNVYLVSTVADLYEVPLGSVVATRLSTPHVILCFDRAAALLTESGGKTCHAAVLAREFGLPCVVGIRGLVSDFAPDIEGRIAEVHGEAGLVVIH